MRFAPAFFRASSIVIISVIGSDRRGPKAQRS